MIISNQIRCRECGDTIWSTHVHDFVTCKCGLVGADGGMDYLKRMGEKSDYEDMSIVIDDKFATLLPSALFGRWEKGDDPAAFYSLTRTVFEKNGYPDVAEKMNDTKLFSVVLPALREAAKTRTGLGMFCALLRAVRDSGAKDVLSLLEPKINYGDKVDKPDLDDWVASNDVFRDFAEMCRAYEYYQEAHVGPDAPFKDKCPDRDTLCTIISEFCQLGRQVLAEVRQTLLER